MIRIAYHSAPVILCEKWCPQFTQNREQRHISAFLRDMYFPTLALSLIHIYHMEYMKGMEIIQSDIKDKVLKAMDEFDYDAYTAADVERALSHETCSVEDFKALISPAAAPRCV